MNAQLQPDAVCSPLSLVGQFFNTSTGEGEDGEVDACGPWNEGDGLQMVEARAFQQLAERGNLEAETDARVDDRTTRGCG